MVKLKEEFDYESLCRKLETQVDHLTVEIEREKKLSVKNLTWRNSLNNVKFLFLKQKRI